MLTSAPPFAESHRYDQTAVRAYRAALAARDRETFGLAAADGDPEAYLLEDALPHAVHADLEITTCAPSGRRGAVQLLRALRGRKLDLRWTGVMRLMRAAYPQLTEGGPLPPAPSAARTGRQGSVLWIDDLALGCAAAVRLPDPSAGGDRVVALALGLGLDEAVAEANALYEDGRELLDAERARHEAFARGDRADNDYLADPWISRALAYALECAACSVDDTVAMLADHEILPLVWTRDAYYVCRFLLAARGRDPRAAEVVRGFIRWLFEVAERPNGSWPRSSLASGQAKDRAFQLDQQLYPLLLLSDLARFGRDAASDRYARTASQILDALMVRRTPLGLLETIETPADDPTPAPYHFSSHVLLWRVLSVFRRERDAAAIRRAALEHFTVEGRFAYAIAGPHGAGAVHYHDANDLPTVFAPGWGFCGADDPVWRGTVDFAWSERNEGFFRGPWGGLGSRHTPHPWPLGDLQAAVVGRVIGDGARERAAHDRLAAVATWDELLPEAYDERTGAIASRHWFAWPVALRALLLIEPALVAP